MTEAEDFIAHHGVKGMKWGIRKQYKRKGRAKGKPVNKDSFEEYSKNVERKYGKGSLSGDDSPQKSDDHDPFRLTPAQKKALIIGGSIVGLALVGGAAYYGLNKLGKTEDIQQAMKYLEDASNLDIFKNPGLEKNWNNPINLEAGTILQRMSTVKETTIRPDGFYAAFTENDVEHYKAVIPKFWKQWGYKETSGFMTQIKASEAIKAPSGKETFEIFRKTFSPETIQGELSRFTAARHITLSPEQTAAASTAIAKRYFNNFSLSWANGLAENSPEVQNFFGEVKSRGYNALIDFNDSSRLADTPLRLLDGNQFSIVDNLPISEGDIAAAQKSTGLIFDDVGGIFGDAPHFMHSNLSMMSMKEVRTILEEDFVGYNLIDVKL